MDYGDHGQAAADQHLKAALANRSKQNERESRMYCVDCEEPIPEERRQAVPGCERCIICQTALERSGA